MPATLRQTSDQQCAEKSASKAGLSADRLSACDARQDTERAVTSIADVEAVRTSKGWTIAAVCRAAQISDDYYRLLRLAARPLTPTALAKLAAGLRRLEAHQATAQPATPRIIEIGQEYGVIAAGMKRRRMELGLTVLQVDYLAGFAEGHTAKLESWNNRNGRGFGEISCCLWCQALGVSLAVVEDTIPVATMRIASPIGSAELGRRYDANRKRIEAKRATMASRKTAT
ncbi:MAG: hypothetical protein ACREDP_12805 [Bradyrhizobium sp.]